MLHRYCLFRFEHLTSVMLLTIDEINFLFCWFGVLTLALTNFCRITPSRVWTALSKMRLFSKFLDAKISYPEVFGDSWDSWTFRWRYWLRVSILFCSAGNRRWIGRWAGLWSECLTGSWTGFCTGRLFFLESEPDDVLKRIQYKTYCCIQWLY